MNEHMLLAGVVASGPFGDVLKKPIAIALLLVLTMCTASAPAALSRQASSNLNLYLRRTTFDPLRATPVIEASAQASASSLLLVQFDTVPTAETRAALESRGLHPLLYIPTNALLVRMGASRTQALAALPGLRWSGPFQVSFKLSADLDAALSGQITDELDLQILAAPDADPSTLARDLASLGGITTASQAGMNGTLLRVRLPATALGNVLNRDDVLWIERAHIPQIFNDRARAILGVTAAQQKYGWLDGTGQIIAITDTGLDVQSDVESNDNPDFAGRRIVAAFTPAQMDSNCVGLSNAGNWNDRNGHGTHVAGSAAGGGRPSVTPSLAGMAPAASLVIQAVSTGGSDLNCVQLNSDFLTKAYGAGARIQNASWGIAGQHGQYTTFEQTLDDFLWNHKDHLLVVAAGNDGIDANPRNGVIDPNSITTPATAKNVLTIGSSENNRPPTGAPCGIFGFVQPPENQCYGSFGGAPIANDFISDNVDGIAAFSGRGPTDDGRIKPDLVAPGTNIVSTASHDPSAFYTYGVHDANYAYDSGTSMSAPMISGMAALLRQWLAHQHQKLNPSAALLKALLLNGATDIGPGQYGTGSKREIPAAWPNNVEGWGRATMTDTIGLGGDHSIWFADATAGLLPGASASYSMTITAGQPLRVSLAWTDYPASPLAGRMLVNDLDLEVQTPTGKILLGNATAALPADCRDSATDADRCNNAESVEINAPAAGDYIVRVRGAAIPQGPQPFALVARAKSIVDTTRATPTPQPIGEPTLGTPTLQPISGGENHMLTLLWSAVNGAAFYEVQESSRSDFAPVLRSLTPTTTRLAVPANTGTHWFRVRACSTLSCGAASNAQSATVTSSSSRLIYLPLAKH